MQIGLHELVEVLLPHLGKSPGLVALGRTQAVPIQSPELPLEDSHAALPPVAVLQTVVGVVRHLVDDPKRTVPRLVVEEIRLARDPADRRQLGGIPLAVGLLLSEVNDASGLEYRQRQRVFLGGTDELAERPVDGHPPREQFPSFPPAVGGADMAYALNLADRPVGLGALIPRVLGQGAGDPIVEPVLLAFIQSSERYRIQAHPSAIVAYSRRAYGLSVRLRQLGVGLVSVTRMRSAVVMPLQVPRLQGLGGGLHDGPSQAGTVAIP